MCVNRYENETIAAIATGLSDAGIGIIRISGEMAIEVGDKLFFSPSGKKILKEALSHTMYYGYVKEGDSVIDEAMAVVMKAPRSFTGEDTVEIHCHGGIFVMRKILEIALKNGARHAVPGEFTKRAFLNGRIDLSRAEAVMDIIHSQNEYALASSVSQLKGSLEREIKRFRSEIIYEIALIESALDDPEHISLDGYQERLEKKLDTLSEDIRILIAASDNGKLIREGIRTVILGKPNVGKSSLMNLLAGEERAIVTETAGTTRDILSETVKINGIMLQIADTAGIRDTEEKAEQIGVERAKKSAQEADLILYVIDSSLPLDEEEKKIIPLIQGKKKVVLLNKSDLPSAVSKKEVVEFFQKYLPFSDNLCDGKEFVILETSMREKTAVQELSRVIQDMFFKGEIQFHQEIIITNMRHKEALEETLASLKAVKESIFQGMPEDFYSIDLMSAYASLGRIIGEEVDDDLIEEIFSKFCIGK